MTLRVLDTGINSARWNIAVTAAMLELRAARDIPDTLRFHRYSRSFLLGRNQAVEQELEVERCLANGVEIARRLTGGATVYMDPDILAWDFVTGRRAFAAPLAGISQRLSSVIAAALARLGVPARVDGYDDILVDGRKVGGVAGCFEGQTMALQGMVFLDLDRARMAGMLKKQSDTRRAGIRIVSLTELLRRAPSVEEVKAAVEAEMIDSRSTRALRHEPVAA